MAQRPKPTASTRTEKTSPTPAKLGAKERERLSRQLDLYRDQLEAQNEELRQAQRLLEESRDRYAALYDFAPVGYVTLDRRGVIRQINLACVDLLGLDRAQAVGMTFSSMVDRDDQLAFTAHLRRCEAAGMSVTTELKLKARSGDVWYAQLITAPVYDTDVDATVFWTVVADITERKRVEQERERLLNEVRAGREQLKKLSGQLIQAHEAERRRLALELHDEIGQALTALKLILDLAYRLPPEESSQKLQEAQTVVDQLVSLEEELSLGLRPSMLDDLGLLPTLLWHFERFTRQTKILVQFKHNLSEGQRFGSAVETAAFRIVQEAMTNVARHADVNQVMVMAFTSASMLFITIQDQGNGFEPAAVPTNSGAMGLSGMRERALLLGGRLFVESAPGAGATISAELPVQD
jgi:PAS domain S-box-containing protein